METPSHHTPGRREDALSRRGLIQKKAAPRRRYPECPEASLNFNMLFRPTSGRGPLVDVQRGNEVKPAWGQSCFRQETRQLHPYLSGAGRLAPQSQ